MRCFISISNNVTNKHLSRLQNFAISFAVIICLSGIIYAALASKIERRPEIIFTIILLTSIDTAIMCSCFIYLFYLVYRYMKDSNLGAQAMLLLKDKLRSAKAHFLIYSLCFCVATASIAWYTLKDKSNFIFLFFFFFFTGVGLYSMSLLVGYAVQITQVSIKSRKKMFTWIKLI